MYASIADLPAHVKSLSDDVKRQYMLVFNSASKEGVSDDDAHKLANGVAIHAIWNSKATLGEIGPFSDLLKQPVASKKDIEQAAKSYQYVSEWDIMDRVQVSQQQADYNPVGGTSTQACSNCKFFISPARCAVVRGEIAPNGLSDMWTAVPQPEPQEPVPVVIVGGEKQTDDESKSLVRRAFDAITAPFQTKGATPPTQGVTSASEAVQGPFLVVKQADGTHRWFTRYSNAWEDSDGETIHEASHKEYLSWAEKSNYFPELWLWHTPGTRIGKADWLDFTDGFAFASGTLDSTPQANDALTYLQSYKGALGVSHGFFCLQKGKDITQHRTYEISVLPLERAAVWTTDFCITDSEKESAAMGFSEDRRAWLVGALGADRVKTLEAGTANAVKQLTALGVQYKENGGFAPVETPAAPTEAQKAVGEAIDAAGVADLQLGLKTVIGEVAGLREMLGAVVGAVTSIKESVSKVEKSDDEKVADSLVSRIEKALGTSALAASAANGNVLTEDKQKEMAAQLGVADANQDPLVGIIGNSFGAQFMGGAALAAAGPGTPATGVVTVTPGA